MLKKSILSCLMFVSLVNAGKVFVDPKSAYELASQYFGFYIINRASFMNTEKIKVFVENIKEQCLKYKFDEKQTLQQVLTLAEANVQYYDRLIKLPLGVRVRMTCKKALLPLAVAGLSVVVVYFMKQAYNNAPENIKRTEKKLAELGAGCVLAFDGRAQAWASPNADKVAIRNELWNLATYTSQARGEKVLLAAVATAILSPLFTYIGIQELLDQFYPAYYREKFRFIADELKKHQLD